MTGVTARLRELYDEVDAAGWIDQPTLDAASRKASEITLLRAVLAVVEAAEEYALRSASPSRHLRDALAALEAAVPRRSTFDPEFERPVPRVSMISHSTTCAVHATGHGSCSCGAIPRGQT